MIRLRAATPAAWVNAVLGDFNAFLLDHAACERKVSSMAMSFVSHYPDRRDLVSAMIDLAREELEHFHRVYRLIAERNLTLAPDTKDPYMGQLQKEIRRGRDDYFLDRLLVAGVVEARGHERFGLVADALPPGPLKDFYAEITRSEAQHHGLFVRLAMLYFEKDTVKSRLDEWLEIEARIVSKLPPRPAVH